MEAVERCLEKVACFFLKKKKFGMCSGATGLSHLMLDGSAAVLTGRWRQPSPGQNQGPNSGDKRARNVLQPD